MAGQPDSGVRVHVRDVIVKILNTWSDAPRSAAKKEIKNIPCRRSHTHFQIQERLPSTSDRIYSHQHNNRKPGSMKSLRAHNSTRIKDCPSGKKIHNISVSNQLSSFVANTRLTLNLSFFAVGPPDPKTPAEVPLIDIMTVSFFSSANYSYPISTPLSLSLSNGQTHNMTP